MKFIISTLLGFGKAFSRSEALFGFIFTVMGFIVATGRGGIASLITPLGISPCSYSSFLKWFESKAVNFEKLKSLWVNWVLETQKDILVVESERIVLVSDAKKNAKAGKKMPGVKKLFQGSGSNSKPEYIMGHYWEHISALAQGESGSYKSIPLAQKITDGIIRSNRDRRTLPDKQLELLKDLIKEGRKFLEIADAGYCSAAHAREKRRLQIALLTRAKKNAVAYELADEPEKPKRGRPKLFGSKHHVIDLLQTEELKEAEVFTYGRKRKVQYVEKVMMWHGYTETGSRNEAQSTLVRFVVVKGGENGGIILLCTDIDIPAWRVIELYSARFSIETSFQASVEHTHYGSYLFWTKEDLKKGKGTKNHHTHHMSDKERERFETKLRSYHLFQFCSGVAQGLLQIISLREGKTIWQRMTRWIRTIRPNIEPSEGVVKSVIISEYYDFIQHSSHEHMKKNTLGKELLHYLKLIEKESTEEKLAA